MSAVVGRRDFLRGRLSKAQYVRPPTAIAEPQFQSQCDGCGDCVDACPQAILILTDNAPVVDFKTGAGECTFCAECADACPTGALSADDARPWPWKAEINYLNCLSYQGTTCRACSDICEPRAIRFQLTPGGKDVALLDGQACTGCGACFSVCPVSAVRLIESDNHLAEVVE